jgi:2-haloacid dehalogenase
MAPSISVLLFDVFGTTMDWRTRLITAFSPLTLQAGEMALTWHRSYVAAVGEISAGNRPFVDFQTILRESLDRTLAQHGLIVSEADRYRLLGAWHRMPAWPDVVPGLMRLRQQFTVACLSNGHFALLTYLSKHACLSWDAILSAELFGQYKTHPSVYAGACRLLRKMPDQVMLVASHQPDLDAARQAGMKTAFVHRPFEFGTPAQEPPNADADIVVSDFLELAKELGL